jgi:hypothetical protein
MPGPQSESDSFLSDFVLSQAGQRRAKDNRPRANSGAIARPNFARSVADFAASVVQFPV